MQEHHLRRGFEDVFGGYASSRGHDAPPWLRNGGRPGKLRNGCARERTASMHRRVLIGAPSNFSRPGHGYCGRELTGTAPAGAIYLESFNSLSRGAEVPWRAGGVSNVCPQRWRNVAEVHTKAAGPSRKSKQNGEVHPICGGVVRLEPTAGASRSAAGLSAMIEAAQQRRLLGSPVCCTL